MANGSYLASAAEAERNRRFQAEQNYQSREMQKGMFGAELDFKKTQYNNLWDIQKANYDAEQRIINKQMINLEKDQDYTRRLADIKEGQNVNMLDVVFGNKTGEEWGTALRQRWGQRLPDFMGYPTDEELADKPEYDDYEHITPEDIKGLSKENLMELIRMQMLRNAKTDSTTGLMQLINQSFDTGVTK